MEKKAMLGHKVRRLRRDLGLTQAQMAEALGVSPSYFNLIENNQRPLTVNLLLKLGQAFDVDIQSFADNEESRLASELTEVFGDALFRDNDVKKHDIKELAAIAPGLGQAVVALYHAYREAHDAVQALAEHVADRDKLQLLQTKAFPVEEVRDFYHATGNHFPDLEAAAETLWASGELSASDLWRSLSDYLQRHHQIAPKIMPIDVMGQTIRRFDRHSRRLLLSEILPSSGRVFHLAVKIGQQEHGALFDRIAASSGLSSPEAIKLLRAGLANYFAGAVMMPYDRFLQTAKTTRYDIEILQRRFGASFEQVCHRLTTLQRPSARGVPFFLIRVDKAGNVSKRFSAMGMHFARFGGACPRWNVYDAFRTPGLIQTQLASMPDGSTYFSLARTITKPGGGYHQPPQQFAIGLGCEVAHAPQLVYADGLDLERTEAAVPIGINCRLCERPDCSQRAHPPLNHRMIVDENLRGLGAYFFTPNAPPG